MPSSNLKQLGILMTGVAAGLALSLSLSAIGEKSGAQPLPIKELRAFTDVFSTVKRDYVESIEDKRLITEAIGGMLSGLDPHSAYLDPDAFKDLQVSTQGEFGGLGIEVGSEEGYVKVISPIEDTPAFRAGIKSGDLIIKINETPVKGMALDAAVKLMRGKPATKITLTLARKGVADPIVVTLTREIIKVHSVKARLIEPGYAYVRITQFQENTAPSLVENLNKLGAQGKVNGLVLDLRNDPGGLLNGAVAVSAAFLKENVTVVSTKGRTGDANRDYKAAPQYYTHGLQLDVLSSLPGWTRQVPMVVLVNGGSASASEIVAGALQDHKRAILLGTRTFGKGSVQSILPLENGAAIKLTTARYYTPKGRSIQAKGIDPDLVVEDPADTTSPSLYLHEADLPKHLSNDRDTAVEPKPVDVKTAESPNKDKPKVKSIPFADYVGTKDDYQLMQALNKLKGKPLNKKGK